MLGKAEKHHGHTITIFRVKDKRLWEAPLPPLLPGPDGVKIDAALLRTKNGSIKKNTVNHFFYFFEIFGWKVPYCTYFTYLLHFTDSAVYYLPFKHSVKIFYKSVSYCFSIFFIVIWLGYHRKFVVEIGHHFLKPCFHHFEELILYEFCKNYAKQSKRKWHLVNLLN